MNLKEFLKPNLKKIILATFLFGVIYTTEILIGSCLSGRICDTGYTNYKYPFSCHSTGCIPNNISNVYLVLTLTIFELIAYIFSCILAESNNLQKALAKEKV